MDSKISPHTGRLLKKQGHLPARVKKRSAGSLLEDGNACWLYSLRAQFSYLLVHCPRLADRPNVHQIRGPSLGRHFGLPCFLL